MSLMRRRPGVLSIVLLAAVLGALPAGAGATVYKWTDAKGAVHYDDQNVAHGQPVTRDSVAHRPIRQTPDWVGVVPVEFARGVESKCSISRERVQNFREATRLYQRDARGNVQALSPAQSQGMIAEAERETGRYCAPDAARVLYRQRSKAQETAGLR